FRVREPVKGRPAAADKDCGGAHGAFVTMANPPQPLAPDFGSLEVDRFESVPGGRDLAPLRLEGRYRSRPARPLLAAPPLAAAAPPRPRCSWRSRSLPPPAWPTPPRCSADPARARRPLRARRT